MCISGTAILFAGYGMWIGGQQSSYAYVASNHVNSTSYIIHEDGILNPEGPHADPMSEYTLCAKVGA
ncbi:hypothetical protein [Priestia taiwanensis]|nr:hypothetical protein [Priestia taiwanensis]MBM7364802.1 hypothetical protein [Priestia taiwanensis]